VKVKTFLFLTLRFYVIPKEKAVLSQRWPRDVRYLSRSYEPLRTAEIGPFKIIQDGGIGGGRLCNVMRCLCVLEWRVSGLWPFAFFILNLLNLYCQILSIARLTSWNDRWRSSKVIGNGAVLL